MTLQTLEIKIKESRLDVLPEHTNEERTEIKHSIMIEGQNAPIVIDQSGFVVDGRVVFEVCQELGRECDYVIKEFKQESDVIRYMITVNLKRRHLNTFRKIETYMSLYDIISKEKAKNRGIKQANPQKTIDVIADESRISARTISTAMWLLKHGDEFTLASLRNDTESISGAYVRLHGYVKSVQNAGCRGVTIGRLFKFYRPGTDEHRVLNELINNYRKVRDSQVL